MKINKLALAASITLAVGSAQAAVIFPGGTIAWEDDNVEMFFEGSTSEAQGAMLADADTLEVGDELWSVVTFARSLQGLTELQDFAVGSDELTGYSAIAITSISEDGNTFTFGPSPLFESTYGTGALAALFTQDVGDLDVPACTGTDDCVAKATNGDEVITVGLSEADDFWVSTGVLPTQDIDEITIGQLKTLGETQKVAVANFGLSVLANNTGENFDNMANALTGGFDQVIGSGDVLGGAGLGGDWAARSDFDVSVSTSSVPVPAPLALVGLGLVAMGVGRKRK